MSARQPRAQRGASNSQQAPLAAAAARLVYVEDSQPGIRRERRGRGFRYVDPSGRVVRDRRSLARIRSLVIPPAWNDVWICRESLGHLQATGRDQRGRKQYRYHPNWQAVRDEGKYDGLMAFGRALPRLRQRVARDLRLKGLPRRKVLAVIVRLLEKSLIRIGNEEYVRQNHSFGLTTLRDRHAAVRGAKIELEFRGKSRIRRQVRLNDPRLARIVKKCQELPGQQLFQYVDEAGETHDVRSDDVNDYLRQATGQAFTAKDFRTWAGTALAARALRESADFESQAESRRIVAQAIEHVAKQLGNTKAVCRKSYIHPAVIEAYLDHAFQDGGRGRRSSRRSVRPARLTADEGAVLTLLRRRVSQQHARGRRAQGGSSRRAASKT